MVTHCAKLALKCKTKMQKHKHPNTINTKCDKQEFTEKTEEEESAD